MEFLNFSQIDYFERAKRHEEVPLLEKQYAEEKVRNREFWQQQESDRVSACFSSLNDLSRTQEKGSRFLVLKRRKNTWQRSIYGNFLDGRSRFGSLTCIVTM